MFLNTPQGVPLGTLGIPERKCPHCRPGSPRSYPEPSDFRAIADSQSPGKMQAHGPFTLCPGASAVFPRGLSTQTRGYRCHLVWELQS